MASYIVTQTSFIGGSLREAGSKVDGSIINGKPGDALEEVKPAKSAKTSDKT